MEHYLAYIPRWLAKWAGINYDGEFRNAVAAHIGWGWSLTLTMLLIPHWVKWFFAFLVFLYPVYREMEDSDWGRNWNRKNIVDLGTFWAGEFIGILCSHI